MDWLFFRNTVIPCLSFWCIGPAIMFAVLGALLYYTSEKLGIFESGSVSDYSNQDNDDLWRYRYEEWTKRAERKHREDIVRAERSRRYTDEEIRDRHESEWGWSRTNDAFSDADEKSFLGWLFD
jgi:hypothetical protein